MKKILFALLILVANYSTIHGQIIADHNAVMEFDQIPNYWIDKAKELAVHYGHTSHGSQVLGGLYWMQDHLDLVRYKIAVGNRNETRTPDLPAQTDPLSLRIWEEGLWPYTDEQRFGYWQGDLAQQGTIEVLNSDLFDVSGWSWCGQVALNDSIYIQEYLDVMTYYEALFPDITFFYMTGHCVPLGTMPYEIRTYERLHKNNNLIREHCLENNRVLFDFADIESHDPDGNYYPEEDGECVWCDDWCFNHPDDCMDLLPTTDGGCGSECARCAHTHGLSCNIKSKAFWWMMARIAGWNPDSVDAGLPVDLVRFHAEINRNDINLEWQTFAEINNLGFEIQRQYVNQDETYGREYEKIGFVESCASYSQGHTYCFVDRNLLGGDTYRYRLVQVDFDGTRTIIDETQVNLVIPGIELHQNYPNPFNNVTTIKFALPSNGDVQISIFDILGRKIRLYNHGNFSRGFHEVQLDTGPLASGIYIYKVEANDLAAQKEMIIIK